MSRPPFDAYFILGGRTYLGDGSIEVSTVFLAINPNAGTGLPPNPFETMVRRGDGPWSEQRRWRSWQEALQGHEAVVRRLASPDPSSTGTG